jgi:hypothetical protein
MKLRHILIIIMFCIPAWVYAGHFTVGYNGFFEDFDDISMDHKADAFYKTDMGLYFGPEIKYFAHEDSFAYAAMAGYARAIGNTKIIPYVEMGYSWEDSVQSVVAEKANQFEYNLGVEFPLFGGVRFQYEIDQLFDHAKVTQ